MRMYLKIIEKTFSNQYIALVIGALLLAYRGYYRLCSPYLWAEDGVIFTQQAHLLGLQTLWTPYNGYLHFIPRIISLAAVNFSIFITPTIYVWATYIISLWAMWIIMQAKLYRYKISKIQQNLMALSLIICSSLDSSMYLQEVFFVLTNLQWILGIALFFIVFDDDSKLKLTKVIYLILLGLTGPFSILILLLLTIDLIKHKEKFNFNKWIVLGLVMLCSLVQIYFVFHSGRLNIAGIEKGYNYDLFFRRWVNPFLIVAFIECFIIWVVLFYRPSYLLVLFTIYAVLITVAGIKSLPLGVYITPIEEGVRYFYALIVALYFIFFEAYCNIKNYKWIQIGLNLSFFMIFIFLLMPSKFILLKLGDNGVYRANVQKYMENKQDSIPIAPEGWSFKIK